MSKIYKITNIINGKSYVGKTEFSIEKRFREHCLDSKKRTEEHRPLYRAMNKYGVDKFQVELLEECSTEEAPFREQYWIGYYKTYTNGYNATLGGDGKTYINREEIFSLWNEGKSLKEITELTHHDATYLSQILQNFGIAQSDIFNRSKKHWGDRAPKEVQMLDKNTEEILKTFASTREAAKYLIVVNNLQSNNEGGYSTHISEVCRGKRKTCQGYKWRYSNL